MHASLIHHILAFTGVAGIWVTLFCETGLFFGFLLPGGSLLFVGGVLASQNQISLLGLIIGSLLAVFIGYQVGYWFGKKFGHWLHNKKDTWYFKQEYLQKAHNFYLKHGFVAILVGRFVPVVRTFVPIIAGIAEMPKKTFLISNIIGSIIWVVFFVLLGYFLGHRYHNLTHLIMPILVGIVVVTLVPMFIVWFKEKNK